MMLRIIMIVACMVPFLSSAWAQKAEIEAVNAQWVDFFNKGDFTVSHRFTLRMQPRYRLARQW
jgi:hypothetical protein